ncbi:MAG: hypothetical protein E7Z82_03840 [Methanobrevibacter sp.]|nr:hypothetical protein [Methanobrevibacter sp.]
MDNTPKSLKFPENINVSPLNSFFKTPFLKYMLIFDGLTCFSSFTIKSGTSGFSSPKLSESTLFSFSNEKRASSLEV